MNKKPSTVFIHQNPRWNDAIQRALLVSHLADEIRTFIRTLSHNSSKMSFFVNSERKVEAALTYFWAITRSLRHEIMEKRIGGERTMLQSRHNG